MGARLAGSGCTGGYEGKLPAGTMVEILRIPPQPYCCGVIVLSQVVITDSLTRITASA
jgi:hypothetical protein